MGDGEDRPYANNMLLCYVVLCCIWACVVRGVSWLLSTRVYATTLSWHWLWQRRPAINKRLETCLYPSCWLHPVTHSLCSTRCIAL